MTSADLSNSKVQADIERVMLGSIAKKSWRAASWSDIAGVVSEKYIDDARRNYAGEEV